MRSTSMPTNDVNTMANRMVTMSIAQGGNARAPWADHAISTAATPTPMYAPTMKMSP